ncbi:MAG: hypothetical protein M1814_002935 [Vezdaea aestivalis]|nr:MAG: hypothetical protein M1814_002935 [Vezdaea aestivalis]
MSNNDKGDADNAPRTYSAKRVASNETSFGKNNPFSTVSPLTTNNISSLQSGASSAFGLGTGAFASFGAAKTPKSPGNALDFGPSGPGAVPSSATERRDKKLSREPSSSNIKAKPSLSSLTSNTSVTLSEHLLKSTWVVWYRPPTSKNSDYEKSTVPLVNFSSVEAFWSIYSHLKRPSSLPHVSDYHIFRKGIRPVWEDQENRRGGKFIVRLKKGVADRYWENLLLAIIGDQFAEAGDEVCGAVLSVRAGEDVLSVWTRIDGGRNIKIRETIKRLLNFPADTQLVWKSHDDSIAQRSAIDSARQEKGGSEKRTSRHDGETGTRVTS